MNILLTGGGTAGHVVPNLAIADAIIAFEPRCSLTYIGSHTGIESQLVPAAGIAFEAVSTGKFRRYFSLQNATDLLRIPLGIAQAWWKLRRLKPRVVFSKGGFVGFPVVVAAWLRHIPVVIHDSDALPGLATRLTAPFAQKILLAYETAHLELSRYEEKIEMIGNPVRLSLFEGNKKHALREAGFNGKKPVLIVMGGSSGSEEINALVQREKEEWLEHFDIIHITGQGTEAAKKRHQKTAHYWPIPYVDRGLSDLYALASLALTRAGANTLAELEALQIPALLYPLGTHASRGDQMANAQIATLESPLFALANPKEPALPQLLKLPSRPPHLASNTATEKIAWLLLSYA